jgi:hypothetical protein
MFLVVFLCPWELDILKLHGVSPKWCQWLQHNQLNSFVEMKVCKLCVHFPPPSFSFVFTSSRDIQINFCSCSLADSRCVLQSCWNYFWNSHIRKIHDVVQVFIVQTCATQTKVFALNYSIRLVEQNVYHWQRDWD